MYNYIIEPRAQKEYEDSVDWYITQSEKATINFIQSVQNSLDLICKQPYQYRKSYKTFHEIILKKYPFSIIYAIEEELKMVVVFSIYHQKRNPQNKFKKTVIKK